MIEIAESKIDDAQNASASPIEDRVSEDDIAAAVSMRRERDRRIAVEVEAERILNAALANIGALGCDVVLGCMTRGMAVNYSIGFVARPISVDGRRPVDEAVGIL